MAVNVHSVLPYLFQSFWSTAVNVTCSPLQILALLCFFFHHCPSFTFAGNFPTPYSSVDNFAGDDHRYLDNNLATSYLVSLSCAPASPTSKLQKFVLALGRGNTIATGLIFAITVLNILVYKLRQHQEENSSEQLKIWSEQLCRRFSLGEIKLATRNFDHTLIIGTGGFGTVYKGLIDNGTTSVAIKRLNPVSKQGAPEFWTEIEMLSKFRHSHLVSLIGYCNNYHEMILVYEYMSRGTIADHVHKSGSKGNSSLSWVQRLKICIDAARGLDYLHTGTGIQHRVIHRDVKSSNILLDENLAAKISDFGMSKIGPANQSCTHVSTNVKGTCGYVDPEYFLTRRLTRKSDVYSFGVVLFEVLCGRAAVDVRLPEEQWGLARWAKQCIKEGTLDQIIDPSLREQILSNSVTPFAQIADQCLHSRSKKRPTMSEVVAQLEFALALQERTATSIVEQEIMNISGIYDNEEDVDSSKELQEVINVGNEAQYHLLETHDGRHEELVDENIRVGDKSRGQSRKKHVKIMTFIRKVFDLKDEKSVKKKVKKEVQDNGGASSKFKSAGNMTKYSVTPVESRMRASSSFVVLSRNMLNGLTLENLLIANAEVVGKGKLGTLYKVFPRDGVTLAVKRIKDVKLSREDLKKRMDRMHLVNHPNVQPVAYFCSTEYTFLVHEYQENGSVFSHLNGKVKSKLFDWGSRLNVAATTARTLTFMHEEFRYYEVAHGNLKSSKILLNKDMEPFIREYGLMAVVNPNHSFVDQTNIFKENNPTSSCAYNKFEEDVYRFGLILLELLTGKLVQDPDSEFDLASWVVNSMAREEWTAEVFDKNLISEGASEERMVELLHVALKYCINPSHNGSPNMSQIARMVDSIREAEERFISPYVW